MIINENQKHILLVEDDDYSAEIVTEYIKEIGVGVDRVNTGKQAIDILRQNSYSLVLMDVELPDVNGLEVTDYIKQKLQINTPVIAISAYSGNKEINHAYKLGIDDYIVKPIDIDILFSKIKTWINDFEVINIKDGIAHFDGQTNLYKKAQKRFANVYCNLPEQLNKIYYANHAEFYRQVHNLKSASKTIGAKNLYSVILFIENKINNKQEVLEMDRLNLKIKLENVLKEINACE